MSMSDASESDLLKLLFQNITWANIGDATGLVGSAAAGSFYIALHTADPGEAGNQGTSEAAYTNYARVAVARSSSGFTLSGTSPTQVANAAQVTFPSCGATGATVTHFSIGRASSGAGEIIDSGPLGTSLIVNQGIAPLFAAGALVVTLD